MKKIVIFTILLFFVYGINYSQINFEAEFPKVFEINQYKEHYDTFLAQSKVLLLGVCDNNLTTTYQLWNEMLANLEKFSIDRGLDLAGVRMFIRVIWNPDGSIKHFAFESRGNSKVIDKAMFAKITEDFCSYYQLPKSHTSSFFHYGSVNFPTKKR